MNTHHFSHLESIYRNYDIRGLFPEEINSEEVEKIGRAIVGKFGCQNIAIGRDNRPSADVLFAALCRGITSQGCNVIDLGLVTTPMACFVCGRKEVDATVMITASHMPAEYNGLKISIEDAKPVDSVCLQEIRASVESNSFPEVAKSGMVSENSPLRDWRKYFRERFNFAARPFHLVVDPANMIGVLELDTFKEFDDEIKVTSINDQFDSTCPAHEANPIKLETLTQLSQSVKDHNADFGIAFDGDADRVGFVDEKGEPVTSDLIGALLARHMLERSPNSNVIVDPRSTKSIEKVVSSAGGTVERFKVGHTNIRNKMREKESVLGIELSGHFFFKETNYSEGGPLPAFLIMELITAENKSLSELVAEIREFHHSGEVNSEISQSPEQIYDMLEEAFPAAEVDTMDGLTLNLKDWWCNVRPSANDPVMRLNLEADTKELMEKKRDEVLQIIRS